jgi:hypothetical protein
MHTIRLRGPWQLEPVYRYVRCGDGHYACSTDELPPAAKMIMPADWSDAFGPEFCGRVRYVRVFHAPPGLVPEERVWLVVEPQRSLARVAMAEETLGTVAASGPPGRWDITHRLSETNRLEIFVDHPALDDAELTSAETASLPPGGLVGEVRLEIEE